MSSQLEQVRAFQSLHDGNPDPVAPKSNVTPTFVLAGRAIFTIEVPAETVAKTGCKPWYTYQVDHVPANGQWRETWFVSLLSGPDNRADYQYVGKLDSFTGQTTPTAKSAFKADSFPVRLLNRVMARVWPGDFAAFEQFGYRIRHEGKCGRCGRRLTTPESVELGIGPDCAEQMGM
jgi:Family of unknown function (DUF6011)